MTKLISVFIVIVVVFCGWQFYQYWERVKNEDDRKAVSTELRGDRLPGLPPQLEQSYNNIKSKDAKTIRTWLDMYGHMIADPRKAWIELDYCVIITRDNPAEARRIFAEVKARTPSGSPIWPRIHQLEKSYE
jgi:hypothetical protein